MKNATSHEKFFAKSFDERCPLAWWRFFDPFAGLARFLKFGQRFCNALHLAIAWDFYDAQIRVRTNFEKLVRDKACMELRRSITDTLLFYKERGYEMRDGLGDIILRDLVQAIGEDKVFVEQMAKLQVMPVSRKALYYRIWALWDAEARHGADIMHAHVAGGR